MKHIDKLAVFVFGVPIAGCLLFWIVVVIKAIELLGAK